MNNWELTAKLGSVGTPMLRVLRDGGQSAREASHPH